MEKKMSKIDLSKLSKDDLKELRKNAKSQIDRIEEDEKPLREEKEKIDDILSEADLELKDIYPELFQSKKKSTKKRSNSLKGKTLPILWRNPDNENETWKGRGNRPSWLDPAIALHGEEACKVLENWPSDES